MVFFYGVEDAEVVGWAGALGGVGAELVGGCLVEEGG